MFSEGHCTEIQSQSSFTWWLGQTLGSLNPLINLLLLGRRQNKKKQDFLTSALLTFWSGSFFVCCLVHYNKFNSIPGPHPLASSSILPIVTVRLSPDITKSSGGGMGRQNSLLSREHWLKRSLQRF